MPVTPANNRLISQRSLDWRIRLGLGVTGGWLLLGGIYVSTAIGWGNFASLDADELGSFLEGAFAPLAFLWLVIGYFLQQKELEQNTLALQAQAEEIQRTAEQAVIQSEKMAATEVHARQDTFLQIAESVNRQLGSISGMLFISSQGTTGDGNVSNEELSQLFTLKSGTDPEIFSRRMLELYVQLSEDRQYALFYGTPTRARHANNFIYTFERMMARAENVDPDNMIRDSLLGSAHGFLYSIALRQRKKAPPELADPQATGTYIEL